MRCLHRHVSTSSPYSPSPPGCTSRAWRTSPAAASSRTCRGCCPTPSRRACLRHRRGRCAPGRRRGGGRRLSREPRFDVTIMAPARITVVISGRGSNLVALIDAVNAGKIAGVITQVISNRPGAQGLVHAAKAGIATMVVDHTTFASREAFEGALAAAIDDGRPDLVVLAGFMRVLGADFVRHYEGRMLNIHPSLLPASPGLDTHRRALADGAKRHGCSVHFVTPTVDGGPIVAQAEVPVLPGDDEATLAARVLEAEHRLLPDIVGRYCAGRLVLDHGRVRIIDTRTPAGGS